MKKLNTTSATQVTESLESRINKHNLRTQVLKVQLLNHKMSAKKVLGIGRSMLLSDSTEGLEYFVLLRKNDFTMDGRKYEAFELSEPSYGLSFEEMVLKANERTGWTGEKYKVAKFNKEIFNGVVSELLEGDCITDTAMVVAGYNDEYYDKIVELNQNICKPRKPLPSYLVDYKESLQAGKSK